MEITPDFKRLDQYKVNLQQSNILRIQKVQKFVIQITCFILSNYYYLIAFVFQYIQRGFRYYNERTTAAIIEDKFDKTTEIWEREYMCLSEIEKDE